MPFTITYYLIRALLDLVLWTRGDDDVPYIVNPAREDPSHLEKAPSPPTSRTNYVAVYREPEAHSYHRAVNMMIGLVMSSSVLNPDSGAGRSQDSSVKQINLLPLAKEYERALAFHGAVLEESKILVPSFAKVSTYPGVVFRTMMTSPQGGNMFSELQRFVV